MKLRTKLLLPTLSISVLLLVFITFIVTLGIKNLSLRDQAQMDMARASASREIQNSVEALKETSDILQTNPILVNSLELENQFEVLDLIIPFSDQSKIDFVIVYDKNLEVFARSDIPGKFGSIDSLHHNLTKVLDQNIPEYTIGYFEDKLTIVYLESLKSVNGLSGAMGVGRIIDDDFLSIKHNNHILNIHATLVNDQSEITEKNYVPLIPMNVLRNTGVNFSVEVKADNLNRNFIKSVGLMLLLVISGSLITIFKSYKTLNQTSSRISWVAEGAALLVQGTFPHPPDKIRSDDEIDHMIGAIEDANQAIVIYNQQLDQVVLEKTKANEELSKARDAALEMAIAKSQFLSNMSHEIRTPMNGVLGLLESLDFDQLSLENRNLIHIAQQSGDDLIHIINDILTFSKLDVGKEKLELRPFSIAEILKRDVLLLTPTFEERNIKLKLTMNLDDGCHWLLGDSTRLGQITKNLLGNAKKFSPEGSTVHLNAECRKTKNNEAVLTVEVIDSGIGIAPENLASVFKSFQQADGSVTRKFGGTGLGLTICKKLIRLMDGKIGVESELNVGSRFFFTLPIKLAKKPDESIEASPNRNLEIDPTFAANTKILLVEDNHVNVIVAKSLLQKLGFDPLVACNGQEALEAMAKNEFDLILMDCQMPVMDGYEATRAIRSQGNMVPIIALTANALSGDREKCIDAGMNDYVTKPLKKVPLLTAITSFIAPLPIP